MVLPLIGDSSILEALGEKLGLGGVTFAQVITFDDPPMLLSEEDVDANDAVGAIVCVPESILLAKRNKEIDANTFKWQKQVVSNTCGTVAILNLALNLTTNVNSLDDTELLQLHEEFAGKDMGAGEEDVEMHFVALLKTEAGNVYELDGRNSVGVRNLRSDGNMIKAIKEEYVQASKGLMSAFLLIK